MNRFSSINPFDQQVFAHYDAFDMSHLDSTLEAVQLSQSAWQRQSLEERASFLGALAQTLRQDCDALAELATLEMGKTLLSSKAEIEKCAWVCEYYAENGPRLLQDSLVKTDYSKSYVSHLPLGVLLAIMPWNFPYWQVFRFLAPALMAGNAVVLKHARNVPGCALAIEKVVRSAGLPDNIFRTLLVASSNSSALIQHPVVQGVTFTGSTGAGRKIASLAGESLRKTVMELGGSDPYIVLEDADLEKAVASCVTSRLINNGQSCVAAKRFIVHKAVHDDFLSMMRAAFEEKRTGDPLLKETDIGPMARVDLCDELDQQVQRSVKQGGQLLTGGRVSGNLFLPTVISNVKPGITAFDEELFGPVAAVVCADNDDEAIKLANHSEFGLGAAIFTKDVEKGERLAKQEVQAGACFVNTFMASDPRLPFGGIKASGYGRELGEIGLSEFCNIKTVVVA